MWAHSKMWTKECSKMNIFIGLKWTGGIFQTKRCDKFISIMNFINYVPTKHRWIGAFSWTHRRLPQNSLVLISLSHNKAWYFPFFSFDEYLPNTLCERRIWIEWKLIYALYCHLPTGAVQCCFRCAVHGILIELQ